jgi:hypothetical protein
VSSQAPPWEPPLAGTEVEHLVGMLERLRATFRWKTDGLDLDGLRARIDSSALTLGGLLKHLAVVEDDVFAWRIAGERPTARLQAPSGTDIGTWQFSVGDDETAEQVYAIWDNAVERSRARMANIMTSGSLSDRGALEFEEGRPSIRRHLCDLIEEYGRHAGHADLIREAIDGRVGEDPPPDWRAGRQARAV